MPPPLPDALLAPLVETAGDTLRALDAAEAPAALRHLQSFDRRGFQHGPAPRQVRAVLERADPFREQVVERFVARPEVAALLEEWDQARAVELIDAASGRDDLAVLASTLWAAQPEGWEYGLGLVRARYEQEQRERSEQADRQSAHREREASDEARRRAEAARMNAEAQLERAEHELREERRARRAREDDAAADAAAVQRRAETAQAQLDATMAALREAEARTEREVRRVKELEETVRAAREDATAARAAHASRPAADARALTRAAAAARELASDLEAIARRGELSAAEVPKPARKPAGARPRAPEKRVLPDLPPGVVADSATGAEAMLRTDGVVLVVDGYNITKRAWPEATPGEQRERLAMALAALHTRLGCTSTIVFDGDGSAGPTGIRRRGLRVMFSGPGEEADDIVVAEVARFPKRVPVVVASSDRWVHEHAEHEGAVVIAAETLLALAR